MTGASGYASHSDGGGPPAKRAAVGVACLGELALEQLQTVMEQQLRARVGVLACVELGAPRTQCAENLYERAVCPPVGDEL